MQTLRQIYYKNMLRSEQQLQALARLFDAFQANGVDFLPVKGSVLKSLYPQPGMRPMGDADILIRTEQYDRIKTTMQNLGYTQANENDYEWVWFCPDLLLELHKMLMPSKAPDFHRFFENSWLQASPAQGFRYAFSPEYTYIHLFIHYAKHYRSGGIGLRQLTDLWVYQRANPGLDKAYIRKEISVLKLEKFFDNTEDMLRNWFEDGPETEVTSFMSSFIWGSGSFGSQQNRAAWIGVVSEKKAGSRLGGKIYAVLRSLFPPAKALHFRYPVLKKAPWLLPVFWPVRWISVLLHRPQSLRNFRKDIQARTDENIDAYQQALSYVGLNYDF